MYSGSQQTGKEGSLRLVMWEKTVLGIFHTQSTSRLASGETAAILRHRGPCHAYTNNTHPRLNLPLHTHPHSSLFPDCEHSLRNSLTLHCHVSPAVMDCPCKHTLLLLSDSVRCLFTEMGEVITAVHPHGYCSALKGRKFLGLVSRPRHTVDRTRPGIITTHTIYTHKHHNPTDGKPLQRESRVGGCQGLGQEGWVIVHQG